MQKTNKTFCIAPWVEAVVRTDGTINPCCQRMSAEFNIADITINDYYNSDVLQDMRNSMLAGESVAVCKECYLAEEKYGTSMRTEFNQDYKFLLPNRYAETLEYFKYDQLTFPNRLELHVGNLCNLKCLTCRPQDSSGILTEDRILGISKYDQKKFTINDINLDKILDQIVNKNIEILDLRGGESLLVPSIKKFCAGLSNELASKITLRLQTNATVFDNAWADIFNKFNSVELMISIDAYGQDNNYIRYPAEWNTIVDNIDKFKTIDKIHHMFVNTTVSNLSWPILPKLFDWLIDNDLSCKLEAVKNPSYYQIQNLPKELLYKYTDEIKQYQGKFKYPSTNQYLLGLTTFVESQYDNCGLEWQEFCSIISKRDNYRKNSIFDMIPELREYWHA